MPPSANLTSDALDIVAMSACCLNEFCVPAYGEYSCDIDHSGTTTAADLVRLLDLLNGAGEFTRPWEGEDLIESGCP
jgi:hypothetical protein